jgi:hypothetical protein
MLAFLIYWLLGLAGLTQPVTPREPFPHRPTVANALFNLARGGVLASRVKDGMTDEEVFQVLGMPDHGAGTLRTWIDRYSPLGLTVIFSFEGTASRVVKVRYDPWQRLADCCG